MTALDNAHALVIGIADYQQIQPLPRVRDAADIAMLLADPELGAYPPANVTLLQDADATGAAIRAALAGLAERCDRDSTVFVYFSGHGGRIESGPHAGEYLLPVDVRYPPDEALASSAISSEEFSAALRALSARKMVVIFDCCHAGGIGQPRELLAAPVRSGLSETYFDALASGRGRVIIASSRSDEYSYVFDNADYGLFTEHLLAGLRGGVPSEDGLIRIFDLFEYLQPRVTGARSDQHPLFKGELEENFAVARFRGGQPGVVPRDEQGFRFDAYISYVDHGADADWVWNVLVPQLESAGLRVAVSGDSAEPGVARVVSVERGIEQAKRTVVVLSDAYLADNMADFENTLSQTLGIHEGTYRLLPLQFEPLRQGRLPVRLSMLQTLDLSHPRRAEREWTRLVQALQGPLPRR